LVFAIMLSFILFTFAAGVLNITTKEMNFSTSGKNSDNAFYAADSGIECALFNDMTGKNVFVEKGPETVSCFGEKISLKENFPDFDFVVLSLGQDGQSCAKVMVEKSLIGISQETIITSKGYNLGGTESCNQLGLNSIERVLEVRY